ncbi:MAG: hypothetical protein NT154_46710, partial [Verrucomicrobia bacterium]|nr:hypothetical protein [Verrucomicrobiota bacterium]
TALHSNLRDENGVSTGASFQLTGNLVTTVASNDLPGTFRIAANGSSGFFQSYAFLSNTGTPGNADTSSFSIGGLDAFGSANLYFYATWNFAAAGSEFRVSSDGGATWTAWKLANGIPAGSTAAFSEGHSYVVFTNMAICTNGTILGEWRTTTAGGGVYNRGPFNAVQIYADPEPPEPPAPPLSSSLLHRKLYVILLGGQSNAVGWGYRQYLLDTGDLLAEPQPDVLFYHYALSSPFFPNTLTNLQSGSGQYRYDAPSAGKVLQYPALTNAPISRFGPELSMGRVIRDRIKIPNSKVAVIKYAFQGSSLYQDWLPDGTANSATDGPLYQMFQTTVRGGLAALTNQYPDYEIEILGMGWVQGEADATVLSAANSYRTNLTKFVADVRATFGTNLVFALSKLSPNQNIGAYYTTVRTAQQAVADADPRVVATETIGTNYLGATGFTETSIHFLSSSLLQIGRDLGNAIVTASGLDTDEDGLPDAWENGYAPGVAGLGNSPEADYDGDGLTDMQEYQIGTSPIDPADRLDLSLSSDLVGHWSAKKDIRYHVMVSSNLTSWVEFGNPVLLRNSNSTVAVDFSPYMATNRSGFFRIEVR